MNSFSGENVSIGHFENQGKHSDSDLSYSDIMRINHFGLGNRQPRQLLTLLSLQNRDLSDSKFRTLMSLWGTSNYNPSDNRKLLEGFGIVLRDKEKKLFGKVNSPLMQSNTSPKKVGVEGPDAPLVDSGELKSKVAYMTSLSKAIKTGG
jgi:hypothetical protein